MRIRSWAVGLTAAGLLGATEARGQSGEPPITVTPPTLPVYIPRPTPDPAPGIVMPPAAEKPPAVPKGSVVTDVPSTELPPTRLPDRMPETADPVPVGKPSTPPSPGPTTLAQAPATPGTTTAPGTALPAPPAPSPTTVFGPSPDDWTVKFKFKPGDEHLLQMETANGLFKFFVGGRLQIDAVWLTTTDDVQAARALGGIGKVDDAVNFRRARFDFGGTFYRNIDFLMEMDWINTFNAERNGAALPANTPVPTDLWVTFRNVPYVGNVRIGNQKPPISLEHMTSSRFLNFMERSLAFDAFIENQNNGFEFGVAVFDTALDDHMTWSAGVFKNTRNIFGWNVGDGEYDVTARVTYLPLWENDGEQLVHVGLGASCRDFDDDVDRMRARLLLRNGPAVLHNIVAEVQLRGDSRLMLVPELAVVWGPWQFAAEYYAVWVTNAATPIVAPRTDHGTAYFQGGYVELLYFLTGEHRPYNRKTGAFTRVVPHNSFTGFGVGDDDGHTCDAGGLGAWQIGARYSCVDLDYNRIQGSTVHDITLGLNWYLNPYMKWQFDLIAEYRDAPTAVRDGWIYGFGTRIAFDF